MDPNALDHDTPLSLEDAARLCCGGLVKGATLRAAAARGELTIERLGKKIITTPAYVKGWRQTCRKEAKVRGSIYDPQGRSGDSSSLSETEQTKLALAAARARAKTLRESSKNTSRANTRRNDARAR